jgi:hypothetical protein
VIDFNKITNFERSDDELLEFWLFSLFVAGKRADVQAANLEQFLALGQGATVTARLLDVAIKLGVDKGLRAVGAGKYGLLGPAIVTTLFCVERHGRDYFRTCDLDDLETIRGVGPKTARFFLLHTRRDFRGAVLDTHILTWLRWQGHDVPEETPQPGKRYLEIEKLFIEKAEALGKPLAELDYQVWQEVREQRRLGAKR